MKITTKWFVTILLLVGCMSTMIMAAAWAGVAFAFYLVSTCFVIVLCPTKQCKKIGEEHLRAK